MSDNDNDDVVKDPLAIDPDLDDGVVSADVLAEEEIGLTPKKAAILADEVSDDDVVDVEDEEEMDLEEDEEAM